VVSGSLEPADAIEGWPDGSIAGDAFAEFGACAVASGAAVDEDAEEDGPDGRVIQRGHGDCVWPKPVGAHAIPGECQEQE